MNDLKFTTAGEYAEGNKMNVKLFEICFEERQLGNVDPLLTPFDNIKNEQPELREYHNFRRLFDEGHTKDLDLWGAFGPRWGGKLRYSAQEIFDTIEQNPGHDVYIFNHARIVNALTYNVWDQGELFHKGITKVARHALDAAGYNENTTNQMMTNLDTCYCSYFIATNEFWKGYLDFLSLIKTRLEHLPDDLAEIYHGSANYSRDASLNMFPFIVERMFSTYLQYHKDLKIFAKPYDYKVYTELQDNMVNILSSLNTMKTLVHLHGSKELFNCWHSMRIAYLKDMPQLLHLD
jgi:hypothetical protein